MSIFSHCTLNAAGSKETAAAGHSLAHSLYRENLTILLTGELGAGKTTFAQGIAAGLGVKDVVQSPSYALEKRYERFTHIDLYRLDKTQAQAFLAHSQDTSGIRVIEWAERIDPAEIGPHLHVHIDDESDRRVIRFDFLDEPVPDDSEIDAWIKEVRLPEHIQRHILKVTEVSDLIADSLCSLQHIPIRKEALHAAARTHDLLRFVDFKTWNGDPQYQPTDEDRKIWGVLKEKYGTPHETAACTFLMEHGYAAVGHIVSSHRGIELDGTASAKTIEQRILAYADKRVLFDQPVTLDGRFADFVVRYGQGKESEHHQRWLSVMKTMEAELFPDGPLTF